MIVDMHKSNPSDITVGYLTLIRRDGSKEDIKITSIAKMRVESVKGDLTKIKIIADTETKFTPAPPMPERVFELSSLHVGHHLTYGLIYGRIERINAIETSDGRDNWSICAVHATIGGRDYKFYDNDRITVTRFI